MILPIDFEHFERAELYSTIRRMKEESSGNEGVEFLDNSSYEKDGKTCLHSNRMYHFYSRFPAFIRWMLPKSIADFKEECWIEQPYSKCEYSLPYLGKRVAITLESKTCPINNIDDIPNNQFDLTEDELKDRHIRYPDITADYPKAKSDLVVNGYEHADVGCAILPEKTHKHDEKNPPKWINEYPGKLICVTRLIKCNINIFGLRKAENYVAGTAMPEQIVATGRAMVVWSREWNNLSLDDIIKWGEIQATEINSSLEIEPAGEEEIPEALLREDK